MDRISPMSTTAWNAVSRIMFARQLVPGEHLLRAGQLATHACWIRSGLLREYYIDPQGREFTRRFSDSGELSGSLADLLVQRGALVSIEALEPSELLVWPWRELDV